MLGHLGSYRLTFLFWLGVTWLGYVYVIYPFILLILALLHRVRPVMRDDFLPTVSVLISAHNEERDIGWKVNETLRWEYPPDRLEVLVASDASEDRTDEIVRAIKNPRLTFVRMESRGGKGAALNRLARSARGELLFFTDANAHIEAHCLRRMARHFADERVGCVTGMTSAEPQSDRVIGSGDRLYLGYETAISHLESQRGSVLVCDGAVFCIRRSLFRPVSPDLANDLELPMRIGYAGYWVLQEPAAKAIENETNSPREEFTRRRRICAQGILAMWRLRQTLRGLRGWQFVSHKFLRWLTLIPLLCLLVSSAPLKGGPVFHLLLWLQSLFYLFALAGLLLTLAGRRANRLMSGPLFILLGSAGALAGVVDACLGRRFAVWEIPKLSRGRIG
jgi:cellulose synthase/poly-beta-1,6-N-acetylglucosamine synthase-like glycosyltransferase